MQIMPSGRFEQRSEGELATLRMRCRLYECVARQARDPRAVPLPQRAKGLERFARWERIVWRRPQILIECLDDVPRLRRDLPPAISKRNFAIRQVADNLSRTPFAGS